MYSTPSRLMLCLLVLLGLLWALPAGADVTVAAKKISFSGVSLQDVQAHVAAGADKDTIAVTLRASKADLPAMGWHHIAVNLDGTLRRDAQLRWLFDGTVALGNAPGGALSNAVLTVVIDTSANTLELDASQGPISINTAIPLDQPTHAQISLKGLPAGWLQGLLSTVCSGHMAGGTLDGDLAVDARDSGLQASGDFNLTNFGFDVAAAGLSAQTVSGHGRFGVDATSRPVTFEVNGALHDGTLRFGPISSRLPAHDVQVDMGAQTQHGAIAVDRLHVDDPDALQLDGELSIDAKGNLQKLKLDHFAARFPAAYSRYGQAWLGTMGWQNVLVDGQLDGHLDLEPGRWQSFQFHTDALDIAEGSGRFSVGALRGGLDWSSQGDRPATTLSWNRLTLYRIPNGPVLSHWRSHDGDLALQSPFVDQLLNGRIDVRAIDWQPAAVREPHFSMSASLADIDFAALGRAVGWSPIAGRVSGAVPSTHWIGSRLALDGNLSIKTLGGFIDVSRLSVQAPFADEPVVAADLVLRQLDLAAVTTAFNFGSISGHLNGAVDGLKLVNGSPVAFRASLLSDGGGRISQRAVNNLSMITGGAVAGGLQGAMLRLFKSVGYKRLGLDCTLQNDLCQMSGLDPGAAGYTIVEGSGLPSINVTSKQSLMEWPVLVRRWKSATQATGADVR